MAPKKYINTPDVVKLTGRPSSEIIDLVQSGVLPGHKTKRGWWRYELEAVEKYFGLSDNTAIKTPKEKKPAEAENQVLSSYKLTIQIIENTSK